jgi:bifunctional non-homologous end joining protein LigD
LHHRRELVATDEHGIADFATLQRTVSKRQEDGLALWAFDLLHAGGKDIRRVPCIERKRRLASLVSILGSGLLHHSESFGDGDRLLTECSKRGFEGIVCKHRDSAYQSGKQTTWIKVKCQAWREANRERHKLFERR